MRVGVTVRVYNFEMKNRRAELGLTQKQLADASGVNFNAVGEYERLQMPSTLRIEIIEQHLNRIADFLDMPFDELFPLDYLEMIKEKKLPKSTKFDWIQEVSLDQLPSPGHPPMLEVESAEEACEESLMADWARGAIDEGLKCLTQREREVIELRFGLREEGTHTFEEVGNIFGVTRERIRQIESQALRKLRHPLRSRHLKHFFESMSATRKPLRVPGTIPIYESEPVNFIEIPKTIELPCDDAYGCPLDRARDNSYHKNLYNHPIFDVFVCGMCGFPVVVYWSHGRDPSKVEQNLMLKALMFLAKSLWDQKETFIGVEYSTHYPKFAHHWHAHATWFTRPNGLHSDKPVRYAL